MDNSVKSPPPPSTSHSRLVDAKLAKLPSSTAATSTGWTRPSSTTPTLAPSPVSGGMSLVPPPAPAPVSHGPPLLPHVGKVIQPQHRGAVQSPSRSKPESTNGSSKPAWRSVKHGESAATGIGVQNEFPTAAEVAQGAFRDYLRATLMRSTSFSYLCRSPERRAREKAINPDSCGPKFGHYRG